MPSSKKGGMAREITCKWETCQRQARTADNCVIPKRKGKWGGGCRKADGGTASGKTEIIDEGAKKKVRTGGGQNPGGYKKRKKGKKGLVIKA